MPSKKCNKRDTESIAKIIKNNVARLNTAFKQFNANNNIATVTVNYTQGTGESGYCFHISTSLHYENDFCFKTTCDNIIHTIEKIQQIIAEQRFTEQERRAQIAQNEFGFVVKKPKPNKNQTNENYYVLSCGMNINVENLNVFRTGSVYGIKRGIILEMLLPLITENYLCNERGIRKNEDNLDSTLAIYEKVKNYLKQDKDNTKRITILDEPDAYTKLCYDSGQIFGNHQSITTATEFTKYINEHRSDLSVVRINRCMKDVFLAINGIKVVANIKKSDVAKNINKNTNDNKEQKQEQEQEQKAANQQDITTKILNGVDNLKFIQNNTKTENNNADTIKQAEEFNKIFEEEVAKLHKEMQNMHSNNINNGNNNSNNINNSSSSNSSNSSNSNNISNDTINNISNDSSDSSSSSSNNNGNIYIIQSDRFNIASIKKYNFIQNVVESNNSAIRNTYLCEKAVGEAIEKFNKELEIHYIPARLSTIKLEGCKFNYLLTIDVPFKYCLGTSVNDAINTNVAIYHLLLQNNNNIFNGVCKFEPFTKGSNKAIKYENYVQTEVRNEIGDNCFKMYVYLKDIIYYTKYFNIINIALYNAFAETMEIEQQSFNEKFKLEIKNLEKQKQQIVSDREDLNKMFMYAYGIPNELEKRKEYLADVQGRYNTMCAMLKDEVRNIHEFTQHQNENKQLVEATKEVNTLPEFANDILNITFL